MNRSPLTIELDESTAQSLRNLIRLWGVPPQEAVARAVQVAAQTLALPPSGDPPLLIFRHLQQAAGLTAEKAAQWKDAVREGRR